MKLSSLFHFKERSNNQKNEKQWQRHRTERDTSIWAWNGEETETKFTGTSDHLFRTKRRRDREKKRNTRCKARTRTGFKFRVFGAECRVRVFRLERCGGVELLLLVDDDGGTCAEKKKIKTLDDDIWVSALIFFSRLMAWDETGVRKVVASWRRHCDTNQ